jgi:hypothetical protein
MKRSAILVILALWTARMASEAGTLAIENPAMRISVSSGNGTLNEIIHKPSGVNFRSRTNGAYRQIWTLCLASTNGGSVQFGAANASSFTGKVLTNTSGVSLDLTWQGFQPAGLSAMSNGTIHATITLPTDEGVSTWRWESTNLGGAVIQNVIFPNISGIGPISGTNDMLIVPSWDGRVCRDPSTAGVSFTGYYPSSTMNMQFLAFSSPAVSFVLRAQDIQGYSKSFRFNPAGSPAGDCAMNVWHEFDQVPVNHAAVPYDVVLAAWVGANGDWTDVAEDYKHWAHQQWWVQQAGARTPPQWLPHVGASKLVCAMGSNKLVPQTYQQDVSLLAQDQQFLGAPLLAFLDGWEKDGSWYRGDYFPPQEGWASFDAAIHAGQLNGTRWWLFPSPTFLTMATAVWQSGVLQSSAIQDLSGNWVTQEAVPGRVDVFMDPSTPAWQTKTISDYTQLALHGVDFIELDGFPRDTPDCFNPAHGHPLGGGGNWQSQAWRQLVAGIRSSAQAAKPDAGISTEGPGELYLPWVDLTFSRDSVFEEFSSNDSQAGWEAVPLYEYVYHPWCFMVGNNPFALVDYFGPSYQLVGFGRALVWAQIPGYYYYPTNSGKPPVVQRSLDFIRNIVKARTTFAKKYLTNGSMLPPPVIQCPSITATYVLRESTNSATATRDFPSVPVGAWRASDGDVGIVLANLGTNTVAVQLPIDFHRLSLGTSPLYKARLVRDSGAMPLPPASPPLSAYTVELDPLEVAVVALSSSLLEIATDNNQVTLSWPLTNNVFVLNQAAMLSPGAWVPVVKSPTTNGSTLCVTLPVVATNRFFRLIGP